METNGETERLIEDLRRLPRGCSPGRLGPHPANDTLWMFAQGEAAPEAARQVGRHLLYCTVCQEIVIGLERSETALEDTAANAPLARSALRAAASILGRIGRLVEFSPGGAGPGVPGAPNVVFAEAEGAAGQAPWATWRDESTLIVLTRSPAGTTIAIVEVSGRPVEGAAVALVEVGGGGEWVERASGVTEASGEADLGPADALGRFLSPSERHRCRVRVVIPPGEEPRA